MARVSIIGETEGRLVQLRSGRERFAQMQSRKTVPVLFLLRTTGLRLHFLLRIRGRRWMIAVISGRATTQKSESCEEYGCHDFRKCPVCHLLAYEYFILILQSKSRCASTLTHSFTDSTKA